MKRSSEDLDLPDRMQAAWLTDLGTIEMKETLRPVLGAGEILVRVLATGICGSDLAAFRGTHPYKVPPTILGHEFAGEVVARGERATKFRVGQIVTAASFSWCGSCSYCQQGSENLCNEKKPLSYQSWQGSYAGYVRLTENMTFALPQELDDERGALVEPLSIALHALKLARRVNECSLAILGSGNIGLATLICGRRLGVAKVLCIDLGETKKELAMACGADHFVDSAGIRLPEQVKSHLGGLADITVVASGHPTALLEAGAVTKPGGEIIVVSYFDKQMLVDANLLVRNETILRFSALSNAEDFQQVIQWLSSREIDPLPMVTHRFPLADLSEAMNLLHERGGETGKILLRVGNL